MNTTVIVGNLTRDPELRYTPSGHALAKLGVAVNTRKKDGDEWVDGDPQFFDVTVWRDVAENVAESLHKGDRVIVAGKLEYRTWEADDGTNRSAVGIQADEVAPSLRWATVEVTRTQSDRGNGGGRQQQQRGGGQSRGRSSGGNSRGGYTRYDDDEEPF